MRVPMSESVAGGLDDIEQARIPSPVGRPESDNQSFRADTDAALHRWQFAQNSRVLTSSATVISVEARMAFVRDNQSGPVLKRRLGNRLFLHFSLSCFWSLRTRE